MTVHFNSATGKLMFPWEFIGVSGKNYITNRGKVVPRVNLTPRLVKGADPFHRKAGETPALDLDFASNKSLTDTVSGKNLVTFTRASSGTFVGSNGLIQTATTNTPRFDHDPVTGESQGLLIEESRTNLVTYSEQLDQWTLGSHTTVTANAAIAPDGTNTADLCVFNARSGTYVGSNNFLISGRTYTASVWAKAVTPGTDDQFTFNFGGGNVNATSRFTATGEWQRFTATITPSLSSGPKGLFINNEGDSFRSEIYFWGAQVEEASYAASYIPTTSSQVTRAADVAEITGTNFSSFYNSTEGTIYSEASFAGLANASYPRIYQFWDSSSTEKYHRLLITTATAPFLLQTRTKNSSTQASFNSNAVTVGQVLKTAYAYKANDFDVSFSVGSSGATSDTSGSIPTGVNQVRLGARAEDGNYNFTGHIKRFAFFAPRLTDSKLAQLTS